MRLFEYTLNAFQSAINNTNPLIVIDGKKRFKCVTRVLFHTNCFNFNIPNCEPFIDFYVHLIYG